MSDCNLRGCTAPPRHALDTPIRCDRCGAPVPSSTAVTFEGAEYLRHFCGEHCIADWCAVTGHVASAAPA
jgi:hypothetical protein